MGAPESQFQPLTLTVALDEARQQHLAQAQAIVTDAESLIIDGAPMAEYANTMLRDVKARKNRIEAMHEDIVGPIRLALANARKWFTPAIDANAKAEEIIKGKLADFSRREVERVAAEERVRKEAERRSREEAEQQAAAARARAAEAARKAREESDRAEAERKRQEEVARAAREAGDKKAAAEAEKKAQAAAAEKAKKDEEERQKLAAGERDAANIQVTASAKAAATAPVVTAAAEVKGFGMRDNWGAEFAEGKTEDDTKLLIAYAIAGVRIEDGKRVLCETRHELVALNKIDMSAAGKMAKALKKNFNVPGLTAVNNQVPVSRGA